MPDDDTIARMAAKAKVNYEWLRWGKGAKSIELRQKLKDLLRVAEPLSDYEVDKVIKMVPLVQERGDGSDASGSQSPPKRRRG